jgi:Domain of unknown function (DUF6973)
VLDLSGIMSSVTRATARAASVDDAATDPDLRDWRVTVEAPDGRVLVDDTDARGYAVFPSEPAGTYTLRSVGLPGVPNAFPYSVRVVHGIIPPIIPPLIPPSPSDLLGALVKGIDVACDVLPSGTPGVKECRSTNDKEKEFCLPHISFCLAEWKVRAVAFATAARAWSMAPGSHDGTRANAFQHSFWVAAMRNEAIKRRQPKDWALELARRHELDDQAQYSHDRALKKLSDMDLHNNLVGYENASAVSLYRACVGMRRAAAKANAYDAVGRRSVDDASRRQLVYVLPDDAYPTTIHVQQRSACVQS